MGWFGGHLHGFDVDGVLYQSSQLDSPLFVQTRDEADHRVGEVLPSLKAKMRWDYDFGDGWQHNVVVEAIEPADDAIDYPRCVGGRRACPPEDCGGVWGFGDVLAAARLRPDLLRCRRSHRGHARAAAAARLVGTRPSIPPREVRRSPHYPDRQLSTIALTSRSGNPWPLSSGLHGVLAIRTDNVIRSAAPSWARAASAR